MYEQLVIQLKRTYYTQMRESLSRHSDSTDASTLWEQNNRRNRRYNTLDRHVITSPRSLEPVAPSQETANLQLFNKLVQYLTFKFHCGQTILTYYNILKVEEAKRLILDTDMNFSQISNQLNFSSLHYFSRLFKKYTGMSPSEYKNSIIQ